MRRCCSEVDQPSCLVAARTVSRTCGWARTCCQRSGCASAVEAAKEGERAGGDAPAWRSSLRAGGRARSACTTRWRPRRRCRRTGWRGRACGSWARRRRGRRPARARRSCAGLGRGVGRASAALLGCRELCTASDRGTSGSRWSSTACERRDDLAPRRPVLLEGSETHLSLRPVGPSMTASLLSLAPVGLDHTAARREGRVSSRDRVEVGNEPARRGRAAPLSHTEHSGRLTVGCGDS